MKHPIQQSRQISIHCKFLFQKQVASYHSISNETSHYTWAMKRVFARTSWYFFWVRGSQARFPPSLSNDPDLVSLAFFGFYDAEQQGKYAAAEAACCHERR